MIKATIDQLEYIKIMSSYPESKNEDARDIQNFLLRLGKLKIEELNIDEASELIQIQLNKYVKFIFPCGKEKVISKKDYNCYNVLGEVEACLHNCKIGIRDCPIYYPVAKTKNVHLVQKINCSDDDCLIKSKYEIGENFCERMRAVCGSCIGGHSFKLENVTCIDCLNILTSYSDQARDILHKIELEERLDVSTRQTTIEDVWK